MAFSVNDDLLPIRKLTPDLSGWTIRGRVTNKSKVIPYANEDEEGDRFFFDLRDEDGEIRAVAFNDECEEFYDIIKVNKEYYIRQAKVKKTRKDCNPLNHKYEIIFNNSTEVKLCGELQRFNFVKISEIENLPSGRLIDVIGICGGISKKTTANNGAFIKEIFLVDDSQTAILATFWEFQARNFDGARHSVIAIKGAKVDNYMGKSLYIEESQIVEVNPDIEKARDLEEWWREDGFFTCSAKNLSDCQENDFY